MYNWNEFNVKSSMRINWRASLVPAAAVIPAPIGYIKVVAVKKLVVEFLMSFDVFLIRKQFLINQKPLVNFCGILLCI
jgi:lysylphosphatidylglycerol synthetase-like protein (DUF2156 family)